MPSFILLLTLLSVLNGEPVAINATPQDDPYGALSSEIKFPVGK